MTTSDRPAIKKKNSGAAIFFAFIFVMAATFYFGTPARSQTFIGTAPASTQTLLLNTSTPYITSTPTIDYLQTVSVAQATSAEAMRLMVEVTAEQDRRNFAQAEWTVTAEAIQLQQQAMTQQSAQFTATAFTTSVPATATQQAMIDQAHATDVMLTINAPTQIVAMANAKTFAQYSDDVQVTELIIKIAFSALVLSLAFLIGAISFVKIFFAVQQEKQEQQQEPGTEPEIIPLAPDSENENVLLRAVVPCSNEQLIELAEGVINGRKTLAINQWEGSIVHKSIKEIRSFFIQHHFAKVLLGKGGELGIEEAGTNFLSDSLHLGSPPLPFECVQ